MNVLRLPDQLIDFIRQQIMIKKLKKKRIKLIMIWSYNYILKKEIEAHFEKMKREETILKTNLQNMMRKKKKQRYTKQGTRIHKP